MTTPGSPSTQGETQIAVRYWASARAAAGVAGDLLDVDGPASVTEVRARAVALHPEVADRLAAVLGVCSVLVGDRPVGTADPGGVLVAPGQTVEFLPPFAGG